MEKQMHTVRQPTARDVPDEDVIDTLIAISVVAKRLAKKLRGIREKGEQENESSE